MKEFFGIDMTYIMIALVAVLLMAVASVVYVVLRNRVMFQIGVRNIPRRRAQTILIIIGLMLSTLIISTALSVGDTVDYSLSDTTYNQLKSIDVLVAARTEADAPPINSSDGTPTSGDQASEGHHDDPTIGLGGLISALPIPEADADRLVDQFLAVDGVDGAIAVVRAPAPVVNETKGQAEPLTLLVGLPTDLGGFANDLKGASGSSVTIVDLAAEEVYASNKAAKELDIEAGDRVTFSIANVPHTYTVRGIVDDAILTGSMVDGVFGFVMPIDRLQEITGRPNEVDFIAVSNDGGVRDGLKNSDAITDELNTMLAGSPWAASAIKQTFVDASSEIASFFTTIFVVLGLFSIASGMLLIFLIFVMLAAERKVEMGMIRAVGTRRSHLVQMFLSEGMVYNMVSAAIGCALGIGVSVIMIRVMARIFASEGIDITFHVSVRSLIVSYSIGVVLTFLTVVFSSWRIGNLNIVSAIRDSADPTKKKERPASAGGLGVVIRYIVWILFKPESWGQLFKAIGLTFLGVVAFLAGLGLFFAAIALYGGSGLSSSLGVLFAVLGGLVIFLGVVTTFIGLSQIFQMGPLMLIAGPILMVLGLTGDTLPAFLFGAGYTLTIIGGSLVLRFLGAPERPVFTTMGLVILISWLLFAGGNTPIESINALDGEIEMFFLSGVTMIVASTFVLVYNADLLLGLLTLTGGLFSSLVPSIKTAVAYPLAAKFRTGMTIAMISLVMFSLVMFSTMNENFDRIFLSDDALGGYDVLVTENPGNPIDDLTAALQTNDFPTDGIAGEDEVGVANRQVSKILQLNIEEPEIVGYDIYGMSPGFIQNNGLTFQIRAAGFDTDDAILTALAANPDYVIIDNFAINGDFGGGAIEGLEGTDKTFDPIPLEIQDSATGNKRRVQIIGVLSPAASGLYTGLYVPQATFDELFPRRVTTLHYVRLNDGVNATDTARGIERTLLPQGVQADSLRQIVSDYQAQSRGITYLMQGFMGIGLFVGIAAVGVIAFRTVVERRQQIGMLRAIGYTRRAVALSFLMESSFTALLGISSGIVMGLLLAYQLLGTEEFQASGIEGFYINWVQILAIGGFAFIASLIMTIIPSRQASSIPIAEALRYE